MTYRKRFIASSLLIIMAAAIAAGCGGKQKELEGTVATVNGYQISGQSLMERLAIFALFFKQPMDDAATKTQILDQLVRERLILAEAQPAGITVEPVRVESELVKFYGALERQYSTRQELESAITELGLTNDIIASFLKDFLLTQAVIEQQRETVQVSDDEVRAFYDQNQETLYTFPTDVVRASHVLLPADQAERAKEITAKARNGGDFAALAAEYSTDPGSARQGGDLGYFTQDRMVPEFASVAFALKPGEISDPVQSEFGWHVILVVDRKGPGTLTFEEASSDIKNRLLPQKQDEVVEAWIGRLEQGATISKSEISS